MQGSLRRNLFSPDSRLTQQARVEAARKIIFGPLTGLPGERWFARPLAARDMLHWYFPSKFGLQEFRLSEYYEMQAERFRKRPVLPWVDQFRELAGVVKLEKEKVKFFLDSAEKSSVEVADLQAMYDLVHGGGNMETEASRIVELALLGARNASQGIFPTQPTQSSPLVDKRHRFVDPLFRRRRLKWMERFLAGMNNAKEIKYNRHFTRHPDEQERWPTNLGSVTVQWPNRTN